MKITYGKLRVPLQRVVMRADGDHDVLAAEVSHRRCSARLRRR